MSFRKIFTVSILCFFLIVLSSFSALAAEKENWGGVDVSVVEKYAQEYGREARTPYINTDQGDLLLFVFALAGAVGGFVLGYNWRKLFGVKEEESLEGSHPAQEAANNL
jgi:cobalt/nickel transport system permease protein/cobalt/nickel transport protein